MKQLTLLGTKRFAPFFATQFLGAFNDNVLKNALVIMVAYQSLSIGALDSQRVVALSAGIFILPFFLFSAFAGQLSDKFRKTSVIRWVKVSEIAIMLLAALGFGARSLPILLSALFLMGLHSTFFGPAKYSVLPELLSERELLGGNALIETGTFIAILLGTIAGGLLANAPVAWISTTLLGVAIAGFLMSLRVPMTRAANPDLPIYWNPVTPLLETYRALRQRRDVYLSVLGISWFWFVGASLLTLLPTLGKDVLGANEHVVTFFLSLFCIGIALGSLLCEMLGGKKIELGLVPFGSIGLTLAGIDLYFAIPHAMAAGSDLATLTEFLQRPGAWRVALDFLVLAVFGGLYTVPLYTLIQHRSEAAIRSRVIAANNILNAAFMVVSALVLMLLPALGLNIAQTFLAIAILNALVAIYIYSVIPEFLLRFVAWCIATIMYRIRVQGAEYIPETGSAVLVCNHVSYVDWLIISSVVDRPIRFVGYHEFFKTPLGFLFRDAKAIPIAPAHEDQTRMQEAFDAIDRELRDEQLVCIFPEGKLTKDGQLNTFKSGIEKIIERTPVPVIPMALGGLWGSYFSRKDNQALCKPFRRFWSRISLTIGPPLNPQQVTKEALEERIRTMLSALPNGV